MAKAKEEKVLFPFKKRQNLLIQNQGTNLALDADASIMRLITEKGFFLDGQGKSYMQTGGRFYDAGDYNPDIHGLPVPLGKNNKGKNNRQQLLAGFLRPSGSGPLSNSEFERALKIINSTSPNEFIRNQRELILIQQSRFGV